MNNSVKMLSPFVLYCQKVIPLAFDESMSYYECLCALYSYLKEKVLPVINNNAEALEEVQAKMIELKDYVDNYFDNLDIQEEVNNKLDEMADSGELASIIAQYLQAQFIYGFDTVADLKAAETLASGNICRVLGKSSYETGDGAFYRVRSLTIYDTPDDDEIVALTNFPTLIAEKIPDYYINGINSHLNTIDGEISDLQNVVEKVVMFGDSYARGSTGSELITSWCDRVATMMGLSPSDYYSNGVSGGAFYNGTLNDGWATFISTIPAEDKPLVTKVIVGAGANDFVIPSATTQIETNIQALITSIKSNFPNAKIYFCLIGYKNIMDSTYAGVRAGFINYILKAYSTCIKFGALFAGNIGYILHNASFISAVDGTHPNEAGYVEISKAIYNFVESGRSFTQAQTGQVEITPASNFTISQSMYVSMLDEVTSFQVTELTVTHTTGFNCNNAGVATIGTFDNPSFIRPYASTTLIGTGTALLTHTDNSVENVEVNLRMGYTGEAYLVFNKQYTNIKSIRTRGMQGIIPTGLM